MAIEEKDRDDVMDRLLQLGGDKKFLSYDDLNRELPENVEPAFDGLTITAGH